MALGRAKYIAPPAWTQSARCGPEQRLPGQTTARVRTGRRFMAFLTGVLEERFLKKRLLIEEARSTE